MYRSSLDFADSIVSLIIFLFLVLARTSCIGMLKPSLFLSARYEIFESFIISLKTFLMLHSYLSDQYCYFYKTHTLVSCDQGKELFPL